MVKVAVAGPNGSIAANVVNEILAGGKHSLVVLSRSEQPELSKRGAKVQIVDYENKKSLVNALQGVDTVFSCIWLFGDYVTPQLTLLEAAKEAGVRRFVPSDWAVPLYDRISAYQGKGVVWKAVEASGLEYTRFTNGIFMNLWGLGATKNKAEALGAYDGPPFIIEIDKGTATVPGDGTSPLAFTRLQDIARFAVAALDLKTWEKDMVIVGDRASYADVIRLSEEITQKKFDVTYVPLEEIEKTLATNPDPFAQFFAQFNLAILKGEMDVKANLNDKFPEIKPWSVEKYLRTHF